MGVDIELRSQMSRCSPDHIKIVRPLIRSTSE
jgi:hypothetical protein